MPARRKVCRLSPLAERDLEDIWTYTAERWSLMQAQKYHGAIVAVIDGLARGRKGRPSNIRDGYWKVPVGAHAIYYRESATENAIDIIRILHQRMDVERRPKS